MSKVKQKLDMVAETEATRIPEDPDALTGCADDLIPKDSVAVIKRILLEAENQRLRDALRKASEALSQFSRMEAAFADNVMGELILRVPPSCSLTKRHLMQASEAKALCDVALPVTPKPNNEPDRPGDRS